MHMTARFAYENVRRIPVLNIFIANIVHFIDIILDETATIRAFN